MSSLTLRRQGLLVLPKTDPEKGLSRALGSALRTIDTRGDVPSYLVAQNQAEARRCLPEFEELCKPVTPELLAAWLMPLGLSTATATVPTDAAMPAVVLIMHRGVNTLPAGVFTVESQDKAIGRFKFWPGPAEVRELLEPFARPLYAARSALSALVKASNGGTGAPSVKPASQAERDAILARFRAMQAAQPPRLTPQQQLEALGGEAVTARSVPIPPIPRNRTDDLALLGALEKQVAQGGTVGEAAARRAAALRTQFGDEER